MRLLLFSDLHLDAQFAWAGREAARKRRRTLREALLGVMKLAEEAKADAVLCGGDLYEHDRFSPDTAEFIRSTFEAAHPLPIYVAPGNHDWYGTGSLYRQTDWSSNVYVFEAAGLSPIELADGLTLWGAAHRAPANTDNFLEGFRVNRGGINLGLFHASERHGFAWQGEGKVPHAPFEASQIEDAGLNHAFLGHYHNPHDADNFTYPGNPAPLTFGETGERGAVVIEVADDGTVTRHRHKVVSQQIFDLKVDVTGCTSSQQIRERAGAVVRGLNGVARLTLEGELGADIDIRPEDLADVAPYMEAVLVRVGAIGVAYDFDTISKEPTVRGQFVRDVLAADLPEDERRRVLVSGLRALDGREDLEVI
jgi:DNA repair protein SbcD/Mre11